MAKTGRLMEHLKPVVGFRGRRMLYVLVVVFAYFFLLSNDPYWRLGGILGLAVPAPLAAGVISQVMLFTAFQNWKLGRNIAWRELDSRFASLAERMRVQLPKRKPMGIARKGMNAYARPDGRVVFCGDLLDRLPAQLSEAVAAHELVHVKGHHYARGVVCLSLLLFISLAPIVGRFSALPTLVVAVICASIFFMLLPVISWRLEYGADADAGKYVGKQAMVEALRAMVPEDRWSVDSETHPSVNRRIMRLESTDR